MTLRRLIEEDPEASVAQYVIQAQPREAASKRRGSKATGGG